MAMFWRWETTVMREEDKTSFIIRMSADSTWEVEKRLDFSKRKNHNLSVVSCKE
jgi:hypothetical protein